MLNKLIKHEFKATARYLLPLYLTLILVSIITRIVTRIDIFDGALAIIPGFLIFAYVVLNIAAVVVTSILLVIRFYKNLMSDEGYLMFTLPVKASQLITSKLIAAFVWSIISFIIVFIAIFIVVASPETNEFFRLNYNIVITQIRTDFQGSFSSFIIQMIIMMTIGIINNILMIYLSIALGQLFKGHKIIGSFVAYMGLNTVIQIVMTVIIMIFGYFLGRSFSEAQSIPNILFPLINIMIVILNVLYFLGTNYIFTKKLNID